MAGAPAAASSEVSAVTSSASMPTTHTAAPEPASRRAVAAAIPDEPVTRETLFRSEPTAPFYHIKAKPTVRLMISWKAGGAFGKDAGQARSLMVLDGMC